MDNDFQPISELRRDDSDILLIFLAANKILFNRPVDDEFFAAHTPVTMKHVSYTPARTKFYMTDRPVHVLGCAIQQQWCRNRTDCSPLTSTPLAARGSFKSTPTSMQTASINTFRSSMTSLGAHIYSVIASQGASALVARNSFRSGMQGPLPSDQWQKEVTHWQATAMALMQRIAVEFATGPSVTSAQQLVKWPSSKEEISLCKSQVSWFYAPPTKGQYYPSGFGFIICVNDYCVRN